MRDGKQNKTRSYLKIHGFDNECRSYDIQEIHSRTSKAGQQIRIVKLSNNVGKCLELNDDLMALQCNADFLHDQMVHLATSNLNTKRPNIAILGGGDGGLLKSCLKINPRSIKLLELDQEVITVSKKYLSHLSKGSFKDERVKIIIGDAFENIKKLRKNSQHIIFIDLVDSAVEEESQVFGSRSKQLFNQINRCLKDDGVIVCQASPYQKEVLNTFKKYFKKSYGWTDNFDLDSANSFVYAIK
jgi:spermidine synthase|tara:strand:- start:536 stop:1264 length:729 start_codon:yes stop_codon:yes gene_type:complete